MFTRLWYTAKAENRAIAVYDLHKKLFLMKEDDHLDLLGYGKDLRTDDADLYHTMIHPKDLAFLYETEIKTHEFLREKKGEEKKDYKLVYDYRVKNREGKYMRHPYEDEKDLLIQRRIRSTLSSAFKKGE
jgi:hypothetical protein